MSNTPYALGTGNRTPKFIERCCLHPRTQSDKSQAGRLSLCRTTPYSKARGTKVPGAGDRTPQVLALSKRAQKESAVNASRNKPFRAFPRPSRKPIIKAKSTHILTRSVLTWWRTQYWPRTCVATQAFSEYYRHERSIGAECRHSLLPMSVVATATETTHKTRRNREFLYTQ